MRVYGLTPKAVDDYTTRHNGWTGGQSRKVARRRRKSTKMLHRLGRRRDRQQIRKNVRVVHTND